MKVFKTDIDENQKLKCKSKGCESRRHKRSTLCQECAKANNDINNAKALNTDHKIWTVYRIDLDGWRYYGMTGATLERRADKHKTNAIRGVHLDSYVHQQIRLREMTGPEVFALMTPIIVTDKAYADEVESILISEATRCREKVCNARKRFIPIVA